MMEHTCALRMGHLLLDGVFDEEKYERGVIKLLRKPSEEEEELEVLRFFFSLYSPRQITISSFFTLQIYYLFQ